MAVAKISRQELFDDIKRVLEETGGDTRVETYRKLGRYSVSTVSSTFSSWKNAILVVTGQCPLDTQFPKTAKEKYVRRPSYHIDEDADVKRIDRKKRICLWCDHPFMSWGPANRKCPRCKSNSEQGGHVQEYTVTMPGFNTAMNYQEGILPAADYWETP